jgi:hypothetical protein
MRQSVMVLLYTTPVPRRPQTAPRTGADPGRAPPRPPPSPRRPAR